ncbi:histidine--tRNA ligase [Candidatus Curtissbacteria bacterium RIFCSPLOWO2_01_FULL_42_26]|uniref:Histidine--tRNA ligase n=1 Tax=Candidatus Curtissbacteria bacterium RIFCSPLOWO2_01_FULL_42_26 TaxID=1797729 RepID=A0A1F5HXG7_9BACT|nr:MAG: histidine--tRNA ligase [Candidatus Curtissbacteria bacterium RIFCSPLOWO2_01_FULL_42_26]
MQKAPPTPKGFRDIAPALTKKRRRVINQIVEVLEDKGFEPMETPTVEFADTLTGKYGDEERLIYKFKDRGGRNLALRYDLTVPLARYVATNNPPLPFRRYQVGQVFRGENPQHGRYREFTQLDFDTVGSDNLEEDAKIIATAIQAVRKIGLDDAIILLNDRRNFEDTPAPVIRAIDKLYKIGDTGVKKELSEKGLAQDDIENHLYKIKNSKPTETLNKILSLLKEKYKFNKNRDFVFDPTLARGLDYYTGAIFELKPNQNLADLTIGSGGRYDNLIGMFSKKQIPAVGFSFGLDRIVDLL